MKVKINITKAQEDDVKYIRQLLVERANWLQKNGFNQWQQFLMYDQTTQTHVDYEQGVLFVAKNKGNIVGSVVITPAKKFDKEIWGNTDGFLYIHRLVVSLEYQKHGIGLQLLRFAQCYASENKHGLRLDCRASNQKLQEYYDKQGLINCGLQNGYMRYQYHQEK